MPGFALGLGWVGYLSRIVRASMLEVMGENHIRTARAFGLPEFLIVKSYALRIAILPTITLLAVAIGGLLSSAVFVEAIFARPGIGKLIVDAANMRNFPVVQGGVLDDRGAVRPRHADRRPPRRLARSACPFNPLTSLVADSSAGAARR